MFANNHEGASGESRRSASRRRRRFVTRRNAVILGILLGLGIVAIVFIGLFAYRFGYIDRYIAGQIKNTLATYGVRADIREFHTSFSPQTVEILGVELYDSQTGERLGKVDRLLATVRIEDLYALNLRRNINIKALTVEGLELWVNFDAQGRSNFRNLHIPPPEPNRRILFAYSTAQLELKNALIHYGDALHSLSGEARNIQATIQPDDPNAPAASWMNTVALSATNSTFAYDGRPINNIGVEAHARINQTRAEIQDLTVRSPVAETHLQGVMDDWRALRYHLNVTSTVDLTQASDILQTGTALRGVGNFVGTISGEGSRYQLEGGIKSDALVADGIRLQALNVTAKGSGQGESYNFNGRAVAALLTAGDFQLNMVQITGGVMGTGRDFRWIGELRAAAEKSYGTTITGLILRDARAEYRDGVLTASAPQLTGSTLTTSTAKVQQGIQTNDINAGRVTLENGRVENVKLARPVFTLEPSGRYRASADLSLGGGVLGELKLGPAHAAVVATSDQIQLNDFVAEALEGRATGNATISLRKNGPSHVVADFTNFDLPGAMAAFSGRVIPLASRATGRADLTFTDTDLST